MSSTVVDVAPNKSADASDAPWWGVTVAMAGAIGATWWDLLFLPLGDSHDGRINGRLGLHVRNLWEKGLVESGFLTDMSPYPADAYAHHPPLMNALQAVTSAIVGQGLWQIRLVGFLSGVLTVIGLVWLLRAIDIRWPVAVGATALTAATPMFWLYARLGLGVWILMAVVGASVLALRTDRTRGAGLVVVGMLGALVSWPGVALVAMSTVWLWWRARPEAARSLAVGGLVGLAATAAWILNATDVGELADHTSRRIEAVGITLADFVDQQWFFYSSLFPRWYLLVMIPAVLAGLAHRRSRPIVAAFTILTVAWTVALPEASYIHDYWTFGLLVAFTAGIGIIGDTVGKARPGLEWVTFALGAVALTGWLVGGWRAEIRTNYFDRPSDVGVLLERFDPPQDQETGWVIGALALPRWMVWYWDVPVLDLTAESVRTIDPDDLVLLRYDRIPAWVDADLIGGPVDVEGRYALLEARQIVAALR